jgi:predicted O-methyltransferase YrrM
VSGDGVTNPGKSRGRSAGGILRRIAQRAGSLIHLPELIGGLRGDVGIGPVVDGADIVPFIAGKAMSSVGGMALSPDLSDVEVGELSRVPCPVIDLSLVPNPVRLIIESPEFELTDRFFNQDRAVSRSLVSARSQALLYALVRNLRPEHVIEIGTYRAGTSEAICRALHANGTGMLHTADPNDGPAIVGILRRWPSELRERLRFYGLDSNAFYARLRKPSAVRPALAFVDGNHDYEYAAFDIWSAAGILRPEGFIVVDNVVQAGPYLAARDFMAANPGWIECAAADYHYDRIKPFDRERCGIPDTELMILRAPPGPVIGERPVGFPEVIIRGDRSVRGIEVKPGRAVRDGVLHVQCIARGFSSGQKPVEMLGLGSIAMTAEHGGKQVKIATPLDLDVAAFEHVRLEFWLSWSGDGLLPLLSAPAAY